MANVMLLQTTLAKTTFNRCSPLINKHVVHCGRVPSRVTIRQGRVQLSVSCNAHGQKHKGGFIARASSFGQSASEFSTGPKEEGAEIPLPDLGKDFFTSTSAIPLCSWPPSLKIEGEGFARKALFFCLLLLAKCIA